MAQIPKKTVRQIKMLVSDVISLTNVEEYQFCSYKDSPEYWTDEEKSMCDYQGRIINELLSGLEKILDVPFNSSEKCGNRGKKK